uniref:type VII secretion target n=1 Tax=Paractinoplanes polyasparticus TaxID=2856853 RepID=UPI001C857EA3|nr:type VII secretion target [Actinoplanes polyasparticus]
MSLNVEPEAVRNYGFMLSRARDDAQDCKDYFSAQVPEVAMGIEGGLFNPIGYAHTGVRRELGAMLDQMVSLLDASHKALFETAKHYERTDEDSAQRLDQSYPAVQRPIPGVS